MTTDRSAVEQALVAALEAPAERCQDRECRQLSWDDIVHVSAFDVEQATWCQAKVASPPEPFAPDIFTVYRAIALRGAKHLHRASSPTAIVSTVMQNAQSSRDWVGDFVRAAPRSVRIQTATHAIGWLTRTAELVGADTLASSRFDQALDWAYPGRGLKLRAKIPIIVDRGDTLTPVFVNTSPSPARDRAMAYCLVLWKVLATASSGRAILVTQSTGERREFDVDSVLDDGLAAAAHAAAAVSQRDVGPSGLTRTPSYFTCQQCAWHDDCAERVASAARPPVRGGVRLA